jgi:hypothetical protein
MAVKSKKPAEHWKQSPEAHDFPAAQDYLELVLTPSLARAMVRKLKRAQITHKKAKDLLRASDLPLLKEQNFHVRADLRKVSKGEKLSPLLLVRGNAPGGMNLIVGDGYHRICASYHLDENADIPCLIVDLPPAGKIS